MVPFGLGLLNGMILICSGLDMKPPRNKNKGIETSHWKVGEADDFHGVDNTDDTDIEPSPPEYNESDSNSPSTTTEQGIIALYLKRTGETLNQDDAKAATENITGFFRTLVQWDIEDKQKNSQEPPETLP